MSWSFFGKSKARTPKSKWIEWRDSVVFAVIVASLFRWSLVEAFVIPSSSMENSMLVGDYLFVSKFHYGPRTPRTPLQIPLTHQKIWGTQIPSYLNWVQLPSYRLPGLRAIKRGEPVVFNVPKDLTDPTERPIDLKTYLVKRCAAIPGDQLQIIDKQLYINGVQSENPLNMKFSYVVMAKDEINPRNLRSFGLYNEDYSYLGRSSGSNYATYNMVLTKDQVDQIRKASYVVSVKDSPSYDKPDLQLLSASTHGEWTPNNYGPIEIPEKGMKIKVDAFMLDLYGEIIRKYEGHQQVVINKEKLLIDDKEIADYTFQQNYYFMLGDNRHNSLDSRYWGFVPEDHILGKPLFIWFSWDSEADILHKVRWNRLLKFIE